MSKKYKLHELAGTIKYAFIGNSKSKAYKNQPFYLLEIEQESLFLAPKEISLYVFPNLVSQSLWNTLQLEEYKGKKYLFWCEKRKRGWRLKTWKELC